VIRRLVLVLALVALAGCATARAPLEQRTTQGPSAEQLWTLRVAAANKRTPTFEERRHWADDLDLRVSDYLRRHPEDASALHVTTFRFERRAAVGMSREQVLILLGTPAARTTDPDEMAELARGYWPEMKEHVTEAWTYPLGWRLYFAGPRLVDITQYRP
jgi:hypothetical protein